MNNQTINDLISEEKKRLKLFQDICKRKKEEIKDLENKKHNKGAENA